MLFANVFNPQTLNKYFGCSEHRASLISATVIGLLVFIECVILEDPLMRAYSIKSVLSWKTKRKKKKMLKVGERQHANVLSELSRSLRVSAQWCTHMMTFPTFSPPTVEKMFRQLCAYRTCCLIRATVIWPLASRYFFSSRSATLVENWHGILLLLLLSNSCSHAKTQLSHLWGMPKVFSEGFVAYCHEIGILTIPMIYPKCHAIYWTVSKKVSKVWCLIIAFHKFPYSSYVIAWCIMVDGWRRKERRDGLVLHTFGW